MKKGIYIACLFLLGLTACKDDEVAVFEKTADERNAEAIAQLKADLVAPANGWRIKYTPESGFGSYYVLMNFTEENTVRIRTDLGVEDGEYFDQTITYRIDSSLGLELVLENYSFFAFLFEQNGATFGAEFEFIFVNKTSDDALVFRSKTDFTESPTILLFQEADANDDDLLARELSENVNTMSEAISTYSASFSLTYDDKDLTLFISIDPLFRVADITGAARKSNPNSTVAQSFTSPYVLKGDSVVFDDPYVSNVFGNTINIKSIKLNTLSDGAINVCASPIAIKNYHGVTSQNDDVVLSPSLLDGNGKGFATATTFFSSSIGNITLDGEFIGQTVADDVEGAVAIQLYYNYDLGSPFYAMGFYIVNADGSVTFALWQFTSTLVGNNLQINFSPGIELFGEPNTAADVDAMEFYLSQIADGGTTRVFKVNDSFYEFYNPCTGYSAILQVQ